LLARGTVTKKFTVEVDKSSAAAKEKLEAAGGSLILRERPTKIATRAVVKAAKKAA
jgi:ribosomal protein L18E